MSKEIIKIEKNTFNLGADEYIVYVFPEEENCLNFYIQKKQYGIMSFALGIEIKNLQGSIDEFVKDNIEEWVTICEHDIAKIES